MCTTSRRRKNDLPVGRWPWSAAGWRAAAASGPARPVAPGLPRRHRTCSSSSSSSRWGALPAAAASHALPCTPSRMSDPPSHLAYNLAEHAAVRPCQPSVTNSVSSNAQAARVSAVSVPAPSTTDEPNACELCVSAPEQQAQDGALAAAACANDSAAAACRHLKGHPSQDCQVGAVPAVIKQRSSRQGSSRVSAACRLGPA
jgi:hypothetical protein